MAICQRFQLTAFIHIFKCFFLMLFQIQLKKCNAVSCWSAHCFAIQPDRSLPYPFTLQYVYSFNEQGVSFNSHLQHPP